MYTRKQIRYSIKRCRDGGEHPEQYQKIYDFVLEKLPAELDMQFFPNEWDVVVTRSGDVTFVEPERDLTYVQTTCSEAKVLSRLEQSFDTLNDRQMNIVKIVENAMLDGKMEWETYGDFWKVTLDVATGQIGTRMLNVDPGQIVLTKQQIEEIRNKARAELSEEAKSRAAEKEAGISYDQTVNLSGGTEWQEMTQDEVNVLKSAIQKKGEE